MCGHSQLHQLALTGLCGTFALSLMSVSPCGALQPSLGVILHWAAPQAEEAERPCLTATPGFVNPDLPDHAEGKLTNIVMTIL